jgi:hypothetical protein
MRLVLILGALTTMLSLLADPPGNTPSPLSNFEKTLGFTEAFTDSGGKRWLRYRTTQTSGLMVADDFHNAAYDVSVGNRG